jgi:hypothetical protein
MTDWELLQKKLKLRFGTEMEMTELLFLIGLQEFGDLNRKFKKDEKVNLMHIAICTVLEPFGFYVFEGRDREGWPHWKVKEEIPFLDAKEQNKLMVLAVIDYFRKTGFLE